MGARINGVELDEYGSGWKFAAHNGGPFGFSGSISSENHDALLAAIEAAAGSSFPVSFVSCSDAIYGTEADNPAWGRNAMVPPPDVSTLPSTTVSSGTYYIESPVGPIGHGPTPLTTQGRHVAVQDEFWSTYSGGVMRIQCRPPGGAHLPPREVNNTFGVVTVRPPAGLDTGYESWGDFSTPWLRFVIPSDHANTAVYVALLMDDLAGEDIVNGVTWKADYPNGGQAMTLIGTETHPTPSNGGANDGNKLYLFRLLDPDPTVGGKESGAGMSRFTVDASGFEFGWAAMAILLDNVDQTDPEDVTFASGTGSGSSVTAPAGDGTVYNVAGWRAWTASSLATPVAGGGQTTDEAAVIDEPFGQVDHAIGVGHGSSAPTWAWGASRNWVAAAILVHGAPI